MGKGDAQAGAATRQQQEEYQRDFVKVQQQQQLDNLDLAIAIDLSHDHGSSLRTAQPARACHIIRISDGADIQAPAERKGVLLLPC